MHAQQTNEQVTGSFIFAGAGLLASGARLIVNS
jgi:hypothetical protein